MEKGGIKKRRIIYIVISSLFLLVLVAGLTLYSWVYRPSVIGFEEEKSYLFIPTGSNYDDLLSNLDSLAWLKNSKVFDRIAQQKNLPNHIKPGRYEVGRGISNDSLINLLRSGEQTELSVTFNSVRNMERLAGIIGQQLEPDSVDFIAAFRNSGLMTELGHDSITWMGMFLPNTYRFYWNTNAENFVRRMKKESERFWNEERSTLLSKTGLDANELMTLASIVQAETSRVSDMKRIAGVYMNRLNKGIRLQACPTVLYAHGEPRLKRLLNRHLKIDSPYNTYIHRGLPPGPIRVPSLQAINACLNYERNDYIYFCAKEDLSGETVFAKTYVQHLRNARKYQKALDQRNIY